MKKQKPKVKPHERAHSPGLTPLRKKKRRRPTAPERDLARAGGVMGLLDGMTPDQRFELLMGLIGAVATMFLSRHGPPLVPQLRSLPAPADVDAEYIDADEAGDWPETL
jgi:hypothetical protein